MNISEQVKKLQDCRRESKEISDNIKQSATEFYKEISVISDFLKLVPNDLIYRKTNIQNSMAEIVQSVDELTKELNLLDSDCTMQIYRLISLIKREPKNVNTANAGLARPINNKGKFGDSKKSSGPARRSKNKGT